MSGNDELRPNVEETSATPLHRRRTDTSGFTLIELLVVLAILGLLAAFVAPQVIKYLSKAKSDAAAIQIKNLESVLDLYHLDAGQYPSQANGLDALIEKPQDADVWNGPYIQRKQMLIDPWGRRYVYRYPGQHGAYDLYSLGADGREGGIDEDKDLTNW